MTPLRMVLAANPSPMTLDGTRTYLVGRQQLVIIDPGPAQREHLDAIVALVVGATVTAILLTHQHPDHAENADELGRRLSAPVRSGATQTLVHDDVVATDAGPLRALATPGHTPDHLAFYWAVERAVFCGDLMMGGADSALVAKPEGDLVDYIDSLSLLRALQPRVIYPAHGPAFDKPDSALARYVEHRAERLAQVVAALAAGPADLTRLVDSVYGTALDARLRPYAQSAIEAYLHFLHAHERATVSNQTTWSLT